jgi:hypothetical protein
MTLKEKLSFDVEELSSLAVTENANVWNDDNNSMCITNSLIIFMVNLPDKSSSLLEFAIVPGPDSPDSEKFTLKGDGGNLIPYTLTLEATASAQNKPYQVKC